MHKERVWKSQVLDHTVWKLENFSLTLFGKFRESNEFNKEITKSVIWRKIFSVRVNFSFIHTVDHLRFQTHTSNSWFVIARFIGKKVPFSHWMLFRCIHSDLKRKTSNWCTQNWLFFVSTHLNRTFVNESITSDAVAWKKK